MAGSTSPRHRRVSDLRRRLLAAAVACATVLPVAITAAPAGASSAPAGAPAVASSPIVKAGEAPRPGALPARSANEPYAAQLISSIALGAPGESSDGVAAQLDGGTSAATIARRLARTPTALEPTITAAYTVLLGRSPDGGGAAYWAAGVANGHTAEWMLAGIANGSEFRARHTTTSARIDALYRAILERGADAGGLAYYSAKIAQGATYGQVVFHLAHSREYGRRLVIELYPQVLFRPGPRSGDDFWALQVARGAVGRVELTAALAASSEARDFGCDPIAGGNCMLPWPNDAYTRADASTVTGRRVNLKSAFLPANSAGVRVSPVQSNRSDGFSPGSSMLVQVPGIDVEASALPTIDKLDRNDDDNVPVVLLDADTGKTVGVWAELDVHDTYSDPARQLLMLHPVRNLVNGHRYVIGLRNLKNADGATLAAPPVFAAIRDGGTSNAPGFAQRVAPVQAAIADLESHADVDPDELYLAWDFTVASTENVTGRLLHLRDDAFADLGEDAPAFTVTSVTDDATEGIDRVVEGTFEVPNYLTGDGGPGSTFNEDSTGLPQRNGTLTAPFRCVVPDSASTEPARISLYGHGLFGSLREVTAGNVKAMAREHNMVFCGTLWAGMSEADIPTAATILQDLSNFPKLADRNQQGVLNVLFLGRLMKHADGLASNPAFRNDEDASLLDLSELYYDGNSQGGIQGLMATAVAQDWTRAVLGVPAMNYSLLLPRSTDFTTFEMVMKPAYPAELDRARGLALIQLQWDRGEANGYANHATTDPLPNTPEHQLLLQVALGDHQVSNFAADIEARTIGAHLHCPAFAPERVPGTLVGWGIRCIDSYPYGGSAIVYFDSGADLPLLTNTPPTGGHDPHSDPRSDPAARMQKSAFLSPEGQLIDVCDAGPCTAAQD